MKIAVLVFNRLDNDARVEKAIEVFAHAGHQVHAIRIAPLGAASPALVGAKVFSVDLDEVLGISWTGKWQSVPRGLAAIGELPRFLRWARRRRRGSAPSQRGRLRSLARFMVRVGRYRRFASRVERLVGAQGTPPDLVYANDFMTLLAAERLLERFGTPFIYDSHELWAERNRGRDAVHPLEAEWERYTERRVAQKAKAIVTVSNSIAEHLSRVLEVPEPAVIRNVPRGITLPLGPPGLRARLGIGATEKLLVYTGKATFNRGLEELVEGLALLPPHIHLVVLGSYELRFKANLQALIERYGVHNRFHHYGPVPSAEVPLWASEADACVVPIRPMCLSYAYCLPNKLFEGIQARLPIVASNLVEMQRTLDEYQCGLTYESGSIADLREKILRVLESPELAAELRRNAAQAALELNWENERKRLLHVVATVQSSVPAPSAASAIQS